jgi:DNA (cytosine-5)-methyltransferase 1
MEPTVLDLFSGAAGGWSLGMHRAGFRTVAACEADPWRRAVYAQNFPDVRLYDDVRTLTAARLVSDLRRRPDIIVGSPPCQDASAANTRGKGVDGERTGLFFEAVRLIGDLRPRWVALENVPRLRTRGADRVLGALEALGYAAWPLVVGGDDIGANHQRKRVWIIAFDAAQIGHGGGRAWGCGPHGDGAAHAASGDAAGALQDGIWIEPRRRGGENGRGEVEPARDDVAADAIEVRPEGIARKEWVSGAEGPESSAGALPDEDGQSHRAKHAEMGGGAGAGADAGEPWAHWNGGLAHHLRLDDGLSAQLAERRGLAGGIVAAFGDAVVPQITESIGRAIWRVEAALDAALRRGSSE